MSQPPEGLPAYNVALPQGDREPPHVQIVPNAIEFIRQTVELPEVYQTSGARSREEISAWSPAAQSRAYLKRFKATGDIEDLSLAQQHARVLKETRNDDGEMAVATIGKKWNRLLDVNLAMKKQFGVIDDSDTSTLRDITARLGGRKIGQHEVVTRWESQWTKTSRYLALAELTEAPEDQEDALTELYIMIDGIKAGNTASLVSEEPFTVTALYRLGKVEEARKLVDEYLTAENTRSHYLTDSLIAAVDRTQDRTELELALRVVKETLGSFDDAHSKGLLTKYGTKISEIASRMGNTDLGLEAAELISNPTRRAEMLGRLATNYYSLVGPIPRKNRV